MQHTDKQQALARLSSLEAEAKHLRTILEAPESILPSEFRIPLMEFASPAGVDVNELGLALRTLVQLRTMAGTSAPRGMITERSGAGELQHCLEPKYSSDRGLWEIKAIAYSGVGTKLARISPSFDTLQRALGARDAIGEPVLLRMFNTLHGFTPCTASRPASKSLSHHPFLS